MSKYTPLLAFMLFAIPGIAQLTYAPFPYSTGFESGSFDSSWSSSSTHANGRVQVTFANIPHTGSYHMTMDVSSNDVNTNEARLHLDLFGQTEVELDFWWKDFGDGDNAEDAIYFSDDAAATFVKVYYIRAGKYDNEPNWYLHKLNVDSLAVIYGLTLTDSFVIKFQQKDNRTITGGGFAFDDISVDMPCESTVSIAPYPYFNNFESGSFDNYWCFDPVTEETFVDQPAPPFSEIIISDLYSPLGEFQMTMATNKDNRLLTHAAKLYLDLHGQSQVFLDFWFQDMADETQDGDSICISDDGGNSFRGIYGLDPGSNPDDTYTYHHLDLDVLAAAAGMSLTKDFVIKFRHEDTHNLTGNRDGFGFDEINVYTAPDTLENDTVTACSGTIFDSGGPGGDYLDDEDSTITISVPIADSIRLDFITLDIEYGWDTLWIFDGPDTNATVLAALTGDTVPTYSIYSSDTVITLQLKSDGATVGRGFQANWTGVLNTAISTVNNVSCFGLSDGSAEVTINTGTSPFTYWWSNGDTTDTSLLLPAGDYGVVIKDANGCGKTDSVTITQPAVLAISFTDSTDALCFDSSDGTATVTPTGGTSLYAYLWNDPLTQVDSIADSLLAGTFTVTVTDANGCTAIDSVLIAEPVEIISDVSIEADDSTICDGTSVTFSITDSTDGGTSPTFQWQLNGGNVGLDQNTYANSSLANGDQVRCIMTSSEFCGGGVVDTSLTITMTVVLNVTPSITIIEDVNNICQGDPVTFSIPTANDTGATPTHQWQINGVNVPGEVNPSYVSTILNNGDLVRVITNTSLPCFTKPSDTSNAITMNVTTNLTPSVSISANQTSVCTGQPVTFSVIDSTNGGTPAGFQWILNNVPVGGQTSDTYVTSSLSNGDVVKMEMTTSLTCYTLLIDTANQVFTMTVNGYPTATMSDSLDASCAGNSDGFAVVTPAVGAPPYTYDWSPDPGGGDGDDTASAIGAGSYTVIVEDANGCTDTANVTIGEAAAVVTVMTDTTDVTVNGGSDGQAIVTPSGGTPPYTYTWAPAGGTDSTGTGLSAGLYNVTVTDNNGCIATASALVNEPGNLDGGTITVNNVSATSVCSYNVPPPFLDSISPTGGTTPYTYTWQFSTDFLNWSSYPTSDTIEYALGAQITNSTFIRRRLQDAASDSAFSNFLFLEFVDSTDLSILGLSAAFCIDAGVAALTGVPTNSGGLFTGTAITDNANGTGSFDPATAGAGTYPITYTYTDSKGCISVITNSTTVNALPVPNFTAQSQYNVLDTAQTIVGIPPGGTFSGVGIINPSGIFDPGIAGIGSWPVTYTYTDGNGCTNDTIKNIVVATATGSIDSINPGNIYCIDEGISILYGNPGFDGSSGAGLIQGLGVVTLGVDTSNYDPATAYAAGTKLLHSVGDFVVDTVRFSYVDSVPNTYTILEELLIYNIAPGVSFNGNNIGYCVDFGIDSLFGVPQDANGTFSGNGITDNGDGTALFDPAAATVGPHTVFYTYVDPVSGCSHTTSEGLTVFALPVANFTSQALYNIADGIQNLTGVPGFPVGVFTDSAGVISGLGAFLPISYGLGPHQVTYTYTDLNGCVDDSTKYVIIEQATGSIDSLNAGNIYCIDDSLTVIYGNFSDGFSGAGFIGGNGIVTLGLDSAIYNPALAGGGPGSVINDTIVYRYLGSDAFTVFTVSQIVTVHNLGLATFTGFNLGQEYCTDADTVTPLVGNPPTGIFTGLGISGIDFIPPNASVGANAITYTYTDSTSGCVIDSTENVTIYPLPTPTFTSQALYNAADPIQTLTGSPVVGSFPTLPYGQFTDTISPSVITTDGDFLPTGFGVGTWPITYTYTDINGCINSDTNSIIVEIATGSIDSLTVSNIYCSDGAQTVLYGNYSDGFSGTGFIQGIGILALSGDSAIYDPTTVTVPEGTIVTDTIRYSYLGSDSFTVFTITEVMSIYNLDDATISGFNSTGYCTDGDSVLNLVGTPFGGVFTGLGISGNSLVPPNASVGINPITYTYTDGPSGCVTAFTENVTIHPLPTPNFISATLYNVADGNQTISGVPPISGPAGIGTFTDTFNPNVISTSGIFLPADYGLGVHTITYTFTDTNSCINSFDSTIQILNATGGVLGLDTNNIYCYDGGIDTLTGNWSTGFQFNGFIAGNGIVTLGGETAIYDPSLVADSGQIVQDTVLYQYLGADSVTIFTITEIIFVYHLGTPVISGLAAEYCEDNDTVPLFGNLTGGVFSGPGITGSDFEPSVANLGFNSITFTKNNLASGCQVDTTLITQIHPLPVVSFSGFQADSQYCTNDVVDTLIGAPLGGNFTSVSISITGIGGSTDSVILNPGPLFVGADTIRYTYTDSNSCTNFSTHLVTIDTVPIVSFSGLASTYCSYDGPSEVIGLIGNPALPLGFGSFSGTGVTDSTLGDGSAYFFKDTSMIGFHYITYTYTDPNGCTETDSNQTEIIDPPSPFFTNLPLPMCQDEGSYPLTANPINNPVFTVDGIGTNVVLPSNLSIGYAIVTYSSTDANGCIGTVTDSVLINAVPQPAFTINSYCIADSIIFTDQSTLAGSTDSIVTWAWDFDDSQSGAFNLDSTQNPLHYYTTQGNKFVDLTVISSASCEEQLKDQVIDLGVNPAASFSWLDECFGVDTVLFMSSSAFTIADSVTHIWDFGDGSPLNSSDDTIRHEYTSINTFPVTLTVKSAFDCNSSITQMVTVRPNVTSYPYFEDFESGHGGWVSGSVVDSVNSWERGAPNDSVISSAFSGDTCWVTNLTSNYLDNEESWVMGPCFDFTSLQKPMLIFQAMVQTASADGIIVQFTTDDVEWKRIGSKDDGIKWYNTEGLASNPGNQPPGSGAEGWSGFEDSTWFEVRNSLDSLVGQSYVRLRIAFSSASAEGEGFAFDDIWIGERKRGVLVEHFTNSTDVNCALANPDLNAIIAANPIDVMDIQYHTSFPGTDRMNSDDPADPSSRSLYYGVSSVPFTIQDGNDYKGVTFNYDQDELELRKLQDPLFDISLSATINTGQINITATVKAIDTLATTNTAVHIVVVEETITEPAVLGTNGETAFKSVLKKMLPNAAGTQFIQRWDPGDSNVVSTSWRMDNVYDQSQVAVIVFVQDNSTKEVYQAAKLTNANIAISTGVDDIVNGSGLDFTVYPNPTDKNLSFAFSGGLLERSDIKIYNQMGTLVDTYDVPRGMYSMQISTRHFANGLYLISWSNVDGTLAAKKVIVQH